MAGGQGRRLGQDKALLCRADGTPLLLDIARVLATVAGEIVVVAGSPERCALLAALLEAPAHTGGAAPSFPRLRWQPDDPAFPASGPLGGLYSGLQAARGALAVAVGCDMPFLAPPLVALLVGLACEADIVLPVVAGRPQPLHAVYRRATCLPVAGRLLRDGQRALRDLYGHPSLAVTLAAEDVLLAGDSTGRSWQGVNTPQERAAAGLGVLADAPGIRG